MTATPAPPIPDRAALARMIDHTLLQPQAREAAVVRLCAEAWEHGFAAVCVNPVWVARAARELAGSGVAVATVCGFPLGASTGAIKAAEAAGAADEGATEVDMVQNLGWALDGRWAAVEADVAAVVRAVAGRARVKVILETALLDEATLEASCRAAAAAGAAFVKTSTGFGPGGATVEAVRRMRAAVGDRLGVKASGGIRDTPAALALVAAGASRLGTSAGIAIVSGCP